MRLLFKSIWALVNNASVVSCVNLNAFTSTASSSTCQLHECAHCSTAEENAAPCVRIIVVLIAFPALLFQIYQHLFTETRFKHSQLCVPLWRRSKILLQIISFHALTYTAWNYIGRSNIYACRRMTRQSLDRRHSLSLSEITDPHYNYYNKETFFRVCFWLNSCSKKCVGSAQNL